MPPVVGVLFLRAGNDHFTGMIDKVLQGLSDGGYVTKFFGGNVNHLPKENSLLTLFTFGIEHDIITYFLPVGSRSVQGLKWLVFTFTRTL